MARRPPSPAGLIPRGHPGLSGLWRIRQERGAPFFRLKDLIGALSVLRPEVLEDPTFLDTSVLVDGVTPTTTPTDLIQSFPFLSVRAAVSVRDVETGHRVGLVVFTDAEDVTSAVSSAPRAGFYAYCTPATSNGGDSRSTILAALELQALRSPTAELLRSLLPPQYLIEDEEMDLHLRCVFLSGAAGIRGGAYSLCRGAQNELRARGPVRAAILHRAGDAAVLVFDDADTVEMLAGRAPHLLLRLGLGMHDASLFPMPADFASWEASLLDRLLPPFVTADRFSCRVLLLTGLDTDHCDAAEIAHWIQHRLDLIYEDHDLESVIVHRSKKLVVVVLGSWEDVEILLQEPPETWIRAFGQPVAWVGAFGEPVASSSLQPPGVPQVPFCMRSLVGSDKFDHVAGQIVANIRSHEEGEMAVIIRGLIALCALGDPSVVRSRDFPDRAVLLSGVHVNWEDLWNRLSYFGTLDDLVLCIGFNDMALAVFKSWSGAVRLLQQSAETWTRLGFSECRRDAEMENAATIADFVVDMCC